MINKHLKKNKIKVLHRGNQMPIQELSSGYGTVNTN